MLDKCIMKWNQRQATDSQTMRREDRETDSKQSDGRGQRQRQRQRDKLQGPNKTDVVFSVASSHLHRANVCRLISVSNIVAVDDDAMRGSV